MMNFSIIIPHKDIPDLLQRCLDSIPQREDMEIIVVDDNSNPAVVDFDRFPGLERKDVRVIFTKEGRGAGYARNVGLKHVIGKWLLFADADDYFTDQLNAILEANVNSTYDVTYFRVASVVSDDVTQRASRDAGLNSLSTEEELRGLHLVPWGKIIRREAVEQHNLRFDETKWFNDLYFGCRLGIAAKSVAKKQDTLYVVTYRKGSLSVPQSYSKEGIKSRASIQIKCHNYLSRNGNYTRNHITWGYLFWLNKDVGLMTFVRAYKTIYDKPAMRKFVVAHSTTRWRRFRNRMLMLIAELVPI